MNKRSRTIGIALLSVVVILTGCGKKKNDVIHIENDTYQKKDYATVEVMQGDLNPQFTLRLQAEGYKKTNYSLSNETLEIDKVYVSVGEKVTKGELLISFMSKEIQETIEDYQEQCSQKELLIAHYTNLMKIDPDADYSGDIKMLQQDITVDKLYMEEAQNKLAGCQVMAEADGTITYISEYLLNGYYNPGETLMTEVSGTGNYTSAIQKNYEFNVGDEFSAVSGVVSYQVRLSNVEQNTGDDGKVTQTLTFEPVSDMSSVSDADTLEVTVVQPILKDVLYVESDAIQEDESGNYVYTVNESGYREAVWVTIGETVGEYTVITDGLKLGEKVAVF